MNTSSLPIRRIVNSIFIFFSNFSILANIFKFNLEETMGIDNFEKIILDTKVGSQCNICIIEPSAPRSCQLKSSDIVL